MGSRIYGDGGLTTGGKSTVGVQLNLFKFDKKALIEATKDAYIGQLGGTTNMPKHYGKTIKKYLYVPILDDRNDTDQGLDAAGAQYAQGNLWGSSKDVGTITGKIPVLSEEGGRKNRVGMTRLELEGSISWRGIFQDYTRESVDFDTDAELMSHMYREMGRAAGEITEKELIIDLYNAAGVIRFTGNATDLASMSGENSAASGDNGVVTFDDLRQMDKSLTANRAPDKTKIITGSRMVDTKTIDKARYAYITDDVRLILEDMKDNFNNPAYVPTRQYGAAGTIAKGEVGSVGRTRFIEHQELIRENGVGATATANAEGFATTNDGTNDKYDVHPILYIGSGSFTQIGFQTNGKSSKIKVIHRKPGEVHSLEDPYEASGYFSMSYYYGLLVERPEWIGKILTLVKA